MAEVEVARPAAATNIDPTDDVPAPAPALIEASADGSEAQDKALTVAPSNEPVKKTKLIRRKKRPARPQVDPATLKSEAPPQTGTVFNIWYNKWAGGDREDKYLSQTHAQGRCNVATDAGYTRADSIQGSYFCLFFARGICPRGHDCEYLHRLPGLHDHFNPNVDCFGRDKFSDYRDDMGGVGSFMRQNRTLYVGRIHVTDDIEEIVARHFAEWGDVERTRVLTGRGVGFVTYALETAAQFAKEAMAHQSLDHEEVLNVRWATVDPNPQSQKREAARIEEQAAEAVRRALPAEFVAEIEGRLPDGKKRRRDDDAFALEGYDVPDEIWYSKSRAIEQQQQAALEAPPPHSATALDEHDGEQQQQQQQQQPPAQAGSEDAGISGSVGILSASTLAAMKGFATQRGGSGGSTVVRGPAIGARAKGAAGGGGALVGYGSDDDDSD